MSKPGAEADRGPVGAAPADVRITVIFGPRGPTARQRIAAVRARVRTRTIAGAAAVAIAMATAIAGVGGIALGGGRKVGCVSVGIAFHDPRFGRASFDRRFACLGGFITPAHSSAWYTARRHT